MIKYLLLIALISVSGNLLGKERQYYSTELKPQFSLDYYAKQSDKYFDTLDSYADRKSKPLYGKTIIRWEWLPWLKLTGYKRFFMKFDYFLTWYPTRVINRVCKGFDVQPFGRCHVSFEYNGK